MDQPRATEALEQEQEQASRPSGPLRRAVALVASLLVTLLFMFVIWSSQRNEVDVPIAPGIQQPVDESSSSILI